MAGEVKEVTLAEGVSVAAPTDATVTGNTAFHSVSSADYTVLDNDGYRQIGVSTGATDRTVTLPTAADNDGREITIIKTDSGAGKITIDGEGAETINGSTTATVIFENEAMSVACDGTEWYITSNDYSGTWLPTHNSNCDGNINSVSPNTGTFSKHIDIITFAVRVGIVHTAAGFTDTCITLPAASNFTNQEDASGTVTMCAGATGISFYGRAEAETTENDLYICFNNDAGSANFNYIITGQYRIL